MAVTTTQTPEPHESEDVSPERTPEHLSPDPHEPDPAEKVADDLGDFA